jgi:hypothetical protein
MPIRILICYPSRIQGSKGSGSLIRIRNTGKRSVSDRDPIYLALPHPDSEAMKLAKNYTQLPTATLQKAYFFYQCCGSGMLIPDPNFFHPGSRIRIIEFKYFNLKIVSKLSETMIRVVHPGSGY